MVCIFAMPQSKMAVYNRVWISTQNNGFQSFTFQVIRWRTICKSCPTMSRSTLWMKLPINMCQSVFDNFELFLKLSEWGGGGKLLWTLPRPPDKLAASYLNFVNVITYKICFHHVISTLKLNLMCRNKHAIICFDTQLEQLKKYLTTARK